VIDLTIRCEPRASVAEDELQSWLRRLTLQLTGRAPQAVVHLSRLQGVPDARAVPGWLLELRLPDEQSLLESLIDAVRDMGLLGLRPVVLVPLESAESSAAGTAGSALLEMASAPPAERELRIGRAGLPLGANSDAG
jgi:hypothetical protein